MCAIARLLLIILLLCGSPQFAWAAPRAFLGVQVQSVDAILRDQLQLPPALGLLVTDVAPGSPAARAGLLQYDILLQLDEQRLIVPAQLEGLLSGLSAGSTVGFQIVRKRATNTVEVTLGTAPAGLDTAANLRVTVVHTPSRLSNPDLADFIRNAAETPPASEPPETTNVLSSFVGLRISPVPPAVAAQLNLDPELGAVIQEVANESPAAGADLQPRDILIDVKGRPLVRPDQFLEILSQQAPGTPLQLTILRNGRAMERTVTPVAPTTQRPPGFDQLASSSPYQTAPKEITDLLSNADWLVVIGLAPPETATNSVVQPPSSNTTIVVQGDDLTILVQGDPGNRQATITDPTGSVLYRGGIESNADYLRMPPHLRVRVQNLIDPANLTPHPAPVLESDEKWEVRLPERWL